MSNHINTERLYRIVSNRKNYHNIKLWIKENVKIYNTKLGGSTNGIAIDKVTIRRNQYTEATVLEILVYCYNNGVIDSFLFGEIDITDSYLPYNFESYEESFIAMLHTIDRSRKLSACLK
jgi:hypothetical protein